jgi:hypothetical protein
MPALSLDGHIAGSFTGAASGSVSLTTANSNDVIVVMVGINGFVSPGNSVSSVSAPGLTFSRRTAFTNPDGYIILEIWWAPAASPFNGSITVNLASSSNFTVMAIGVANSPNYTSPWDASSPATGSGAAGTSPSIAYTPTNSNDFIIGFGGTSGTSVDTLSAGPGFTLIDTLSDPLAFPQTLVTIDEYQVVSGTPSSVTVSFNSALSYEWALIGDALNGSAPPASISLSVQFSPAYVAQGQQLLEDIIASVVSGSPGLTTFSISGLPPFTTATFSPPSVTPTALTLLTISTTPNTPLGTYKLIITGTPQNGSPATATLILNVITPVPYQNTCTSYIPTPLTEEREQALRISGTRALQMPAQKFALPAIDPAIPCSTISPIEKQLDLYVYGSGPLQGVTVRFVIENAPFIVKQTDANGHVFFEYALFISPRTGLPVNSFHLDVLPQDGVHACAWVNANINGPAKLELTLTTNPPPNIALPLTYTTDTPNTLFVFNSGQSLCPGAGIKPAFASGTLYYLPVTLTNNQTTATPANYTAKIPINQSNYSSYLASDLSNVNWQDGKGNILNSWRQSGTSNTGTDALWWVNLGSLTVPAGGTLTIYLCFYATTQNVLNTTNTGVAPQLTATYAQYDNGATVFPWYENFAGTSLPSDLTEIGGGGTLTVNNGLSISVSANNGIYIYKTSGISSSSATVLDAYIFNGSTYSYVVLAFSLGPVNDVLPQTAINNGYYAIINETSSLTSGASFELAVTVSGSLSLMTWTDGDVTQTQILTMMWPATGIEEAFTTYLNVSLSGTDTQFSLPSTTYPLFGVYGNGNTGAISSYWLRARLYPPNGVDPSVSTGTITPA